MHVGLGILRGQAALQGVHANTHTHPSVDRSIENILGPLAYFHPVLDTVMTSPPTQESCSSTRVSCSPALKLLSQLGFAGLTWSRSVRFHEPFYIEQN